MLASLETIPAHYDDKAADSSRAAVAVHVHAGLPSDGINEMLRARPAGQRSQRRLTLVELGVTDDESLASGAGDRAGRVGEQGLDMWRQQQAKVQLQLQGRAAGQQAAQRRQDELSRRRRGTEPAAGVSDQCEITAVGDLEGEGPSQSSEGPAGRQQQASVSAARSQQVEACSDGAASRHSGTLSAPAPSAALGPVQSTFTISVEPSFAVLTIEGSRANAESPAPAPRPSSQGSSPARAQRASAAQRSAGTAASAGAAAIATSAGPAPMAVEPEGEDAQHAVASPTPAPAGRPARALSSCFSIEPNFLGRLEAEGSGGMLQRSVPGSATREVAAASSRPRPWPLPPYADSGLRAKQQSSSNSVEGAPGLDSRLGAWSSSSSAEGDLQGLGASYPAPPPPQAGDRLPAQSSFMVDLSMLRLDEEPSMAGEQLRRISQHHRESREGSDNSRGSL